MDQKQERDFKFDPAFDSWSFLFLSNKKRQRIMHLLDRLQEDASTVSKTSFLLISTVDVSEHFRFRPPPTIL